MVGLAAIYWAYGGQEIICLFCFQKKLVRSYAEIMCLLACLFLLIGRDSRKALEGEYIRKEAGLNFHSSSIMKAAGWR